MSSLVAQHRADAIAPPGPAPDNDMVWIPGGTFLMGSDDHYPEEAPAHAVTVSGFWIDGYTVADAAFRRFVKSTGYVTVAERAPDVPSTPVPCPRCWWPARSSFASHRGGCRWAAATPGGTGSPVPTGVSRKVPLAPCMAGSGTRCCMSRGRMCSPTPPGPLKPFPSKPSGNLPVAAGTTAGRTPGGRTGAQGPDAGQLLAGRVSLAESGA